MLKTCKMLYNVIKCYQPGLKFKCACNKKIVPTTGNSNLPRRTLPRGPLSAPIGPCRPCSRWAPPLWPALSISLRPPVGHPIDPSSGPPSTTVSAPLADPPTTCQQPTSFIAFYTILYHFISFVLIVTQLYMVFNRL